MPRCRLNPFPPAVLAVGNLAGQACRDTLPGRPHRAVDAKNTESGEERRLVATLGGEGAVMLATDTHHGAASRQASLYVPSHDATEVRIDIERSTDAPANLDLYDVTLGIGCACPAPADAPER